MERTNRFKRVKSEEESDPTRLDRTNIQYLLAASAEIESREQDIPVDFPELSRQLVHEDPPHLKQEDEEETYRKAVGGENVSEYVRRIKEEEIHQNPSLPMANVPSFTGRVKEEAIEYKPPRNEGASSLRGRIKEESDDDKKGLTGSQVFVDENTKLDIKLKSQDPDSPRAGSDNLVKLESKVHVCVRNIAAPWSPYLGEIWKPSWETTKVYREAGHRARAEMLYLHVEETVFEVHRSVILSKIPRLPLLYIDLEAEEEDEHILDESIHDMNLLVYWVYHECLPPLAKVYRRGRFNGLTWDWMALYNFATRLSAFQLMDCITRRGLPASA